MQELNAICKVHYVRNSYFPTPTQNVKFVETLTTVCQRNQADVWWSGYLQTKL